MKQLPVIKISVIIPAFNEESTIVQNLDALKTYLLGYVGEEGWEIIIVDDGSSDQTAERVDQFSQKNPNIRCVSLAVHSGRGVALREGFKAARFDIIVTLDADLSYAPSHIERMVAALKESNADVVLASAYMKGGTVKNVPFKRKILSLLGNKVLAVMYGGGIHTLTCIVRAYRAEFIKSLDLNSSEKEIHLEILYKAKMLNATICEIPADLCWSEHKTQDLEKGMIKKKRRSTLHVRKTSKSHLFFALLSRPGLIFWIPGYVLFSISFLTFITTSAGIFYSLPLHSSFYLAVRSSMISAAPSWLTMAVSFILGIQFFTLGFMTTQSKKNYEETYKTLHAIYRNQIKDK
jgi:glycosyltransferase involved in cell wall biosynthesis